MAIPKNKNFSDYDNYLTDSSPTTAAQAQDYFKNQADLLKAVVDSGCWQPETNYALDDVVYSPSFSKSAEAVCVKAGKSSTSEPSWGAVGGANVADGTAVWKLRHKHLIKDKASQAEAEAGTDDTKAMTPLRTKQAIEKFMPDIPKLDGMEGMLPIEKGGTGATNKTKARENLGLSDAITGLSVDGTTITYTRADGTTGSFDTQDTVFDVSVLDGSAHKLPYASCSTASTTEAKVATITNGVGFSLEAGAMVAVKMELGTDWPEGSSKSTLNLNSTGAKRVRGYTNNFASGACEHKNNVYVFVYDGTYWNMVSAYSNESYNE